jgi:hypothetical protein
MKGYIVQFYGGHQWNDIEWPMRVYALKKSAQQRLRREKKRQSLEFRVWEVELVGPLGLVSWGR